MSSDICPDCGARLATDSICYVCGYDPADRFVYAQRLGCLWLVAGMLLGGLILTRAREVVHPTILVNVFVPALKRYLPVVGDGIRWVTARLVAHD